MVLMVLLLFEHGVGILGHAVARSVDQGPYRQLARVYGNDRLKLPGDSLPERTTSRFPKIYDSTSSCNDNNSHGSWTHSFPLHTRDAQIKV